MVEFSGNRYAFEASQKMKSGKKQNRGMFSPLSHQSELELTGKTARFDTRLPPINQQMHMEINHDFDMTGGDHQEKEKLLDNTADLPHIENQQADPCDCPKVSEDKGVGIKSQEEAKERKFTINGPQNLNNADNDKPNSFWKLGNFGNNAGNFENGIKLDFNEFSSQQIQYIQETQNLKNSFAVKEKDIRNVDKFKIIANQELAEVKQRFSLLTRDGTVFKVDLKDLISDQSYPDIILAQKHIIYQGGYVIVQIDQDIFFKDLRHLNRDQGEKEIPSINYADIDSSIIDKQKYKDFKDIVEVPLKDYGFHGFRKICSKKVQELFNRIYFKNGTGKEVDGEITEDAKAPEAQGPKEIEIKKFRVSKNSLIVQYTEPVIGLISYDLDREGDKENQKKPVYMQHIFDGKVDDFAVLVPKYEKQIQGYGLLTGNELSFITNQNQAMKTQVLGKDVRFIDSCRDQLFYMTTTNNIYRYDMSNNEPILIHTLDMVENQTDDIKKLVAFQEQVFLIDGEEIKIIPNQTDSNGNVDKTNKISQAESLAGYNLKSLNISQNMIYFDQKREVGSNNIVYRNFTVMDRSLRVTKYQLDEIDLEKKTDEFNKLEFIGQDEDANLQVEILTTSTDEYHIYMRVYDYAYHQKEPLIQQKQPLLKVLQSFDRKYNLLIRKSKFEIISGLKDNVHGEAIDAQTQAQDKALEDANKILNDFLEQELQWGSSSSSDLVTNSVHFVKSTKEEEYLILFVHNDEGVLFEFSGNSQNLTGKTYQHKVHKFSLKFDDDQGRKDVGSSGNAQQSQTQGLVEEETPDQDDLQSKDNSNKIPLKYFTVMIDFNNSQFKVFLAQNGQYFIQQTTCSGETTSPCFQQTSFTFKPNFKEARKADVINWISVSPDMKKIIIQKANKLFWANINRRVEENSNQKVPDKILNHPELSKLAVQDQDEGKLANLVESKAEAQQQAANNNRVMPVTQSSNQIAQEKPYEYEFKLQPLLTDGEELTWYLDDYRAIWSGDSEFMAVKSTTHLEVWNINEDKLLKKEKISEEMKREDGEQKIQHKENCLRKHAMDDNTEQDQWEYQAEKFILEDKMFLFFNQIKRTICILDIHTTYVYSFFNQNDEKLNHEKVIGFAEHNGIVRRQVKSHHDLELIKKIRPNNNAVNNQQDGIEDQFAEDLWNPGNKVQFLEIFIGQDQISIPLMFFLLNDYSEEEEPKHFIYFTLFVPGINESLDLHEECFISRTLKRPESQREQLKLAERLAKADDDSGKSLISKNVFFNICSFTPTLENLFDRLFLQQSELQKIDLIMMPYRISSLHYYAKQDQADTSQMGKLLSCGFQFLKDQNQSTALTLCLEDDDQMTARLVCLGLSKQLFKIGDTRKRGTIELKDIEDENFEKNPESEMQKEQETSNEHEQNLKKLFKGKQMVKEKFENVDDYTVTRQKLNILENIDMHDLLMCDNTYVNTILSYCWMNVDETIAEYIKITNEKDLDKGHDGKIPIMKACSTNSILYYEQTRSTFTYDLNIHKTFFPTIGVAGLCYHVGGQLGGFNEVPVECFYSPLRIPFRLSTNSLNLKRAILDHTNREIFQQPLIQAYIENDWNQFGKYFGAFQSFLMILLLALFSIVTLPLEKFGVEEDTDTYNMLRSSWWIYGALFLTGLSLLNEVIEYQQTEKSFYEWMNFFDALLGIMLIFVLFTTLISRYQKDLFSEAILNYIQLPTIILLWLMVLIKYCASFSFFTFDVRMIQEQIAGVYKFFIIFFFFIFATGHILLYVEEEGTSLAKAWRTAYMASSGEMGEEDGYDIVTWLSYAVCVFILNAILINTVIGIMANKFGEVESNRDEFIARSRLEKSCEGEVICQIFYNLFHSITFGFFSSDIEVDKQFFYLFKKEPIKTSANADDVLVGQELLLFRKLKKHNHKQMVHTRNEISRIFNEHLEHLFEQLQDNSDNLKSPKIFEKSHTQVYQRNNSLLLGDGVSPDLANHGRD